MPTRVTMDLVTDHSWRYSGDRTPGPPRYQEILNEAFPTNARQLRDQPNPVPVTVRVVWKDDGEETIAGSAIRWDAGHVFVQIDDSRCAAIGVWVGPGDVRRR